SSHIDRFTSADDSQLNIESLIKNLENVIMKKLSVLYVTESFISLSASSAASFSATLFSISFSAALCQSSILVSVSGSPAPAISVSVTLTSATSASATAFITNSSCFRKMLCRLSELYFLMYTLSLLLLISRIIYYICVFRNRNMNVILFYICRWEAFASVSEIILIKDNNAAETTLFCSQASLITFSFSSVKKIVCISDYKYLTL
ncbi:hypothetical protein BDBG_18074, partial [Blastomyces gilchristii SLH14081]